MSKKMLIDASHPEETRVVIVNGTKVEELDFESAAKRQLRGNLYLARVTRVEPSLQAAFVEYGGNRHGFLAFSEIHPDYYQIPYEDRMALLEEEEAQNLEEKAEEEKEEAEKASKSKRKSAKTKTKSKSKAVDDEAEVSDEEDAKEKGSDDSDESEKSSNDDVKADESESDENSDTESSVEEISDDADEEVADEQEKTAKKRRSRSYRHRYKIQEVIKRGQILLIQVVKEERGNKGAAMTTYLSLAGRYCVLMPNTAKGGGISRKIANGTDRKRLKSVVSEFEVPQGMGVIVRTAGAKRTKSEIKRDYDYLCRLWETIRDTTLKSIAPSLIHEEGNLVKRSIRDLYNKDIDEILVQGDEAYKSAKAFIKMLMPSHAKNVKAYKEDIPLYLRYQVESQIENSLDSVVQLKSGGYLVIHPTEALVSIDVNSGRSTKERNVERTALKTNLEAADEVARQMRLRDLAGLVVIDFIDMDENRNNRSVEKRMKDALSRDRARVQAGRISQFGLMEISRQRRRRSLLDGSTTSCPHCQGVGRKRTVESSALRALRAVAEKAARAQTRKARLTVDNDVAAFILNHKRQELNEIQTQFGMYTIVEADPDLLMPEYALTVLEKASGKANDPLAEIEKEAKKAAEKTAKSSRKKKSSSSSEKTEDKTDDEPGSEDGKDGKKRRRRGRRGGRKRSKSDNSSTEETAADQDADNSVTASDAKTDKTDETETAAPKKRRRRRSSSKKTTEKTETETAKGSEPKAAEPVEKTDAKPKRTRSPRKKSTAKAASEPATKETKAEVEAEAEAPKPKRSTTRRKAPARKPKEDVDSSQEPAATKKTTARKTTRKKPTSKTKADAKTTKDAAKEPVAKDKPADKDEGSTSSRKGWWQRKRKKE